MDQSAALAERTKRFALAVLEELKALPTGEPGPTIRRQLTKSATSVAANYRASRRARSHHEFTTRISTVSEEADETLFWLELIRDAKVDTSPNVQKLLAESHELCAIFSAMVGTARRRDRCRN